MHDLARVPGCYVLNHILRHGVVTRFTATAGAPVYFSILISHTILPSPSCRWPFSRCATVEDAGGEASSHRSLDLSLWMYVSVTA